MSAIREAIVRWLGANRDFALVRGYGLHPVQTVYLGNERARATPFVASNGLENFSPADISRELCTMSLEGRLSQRCIEDYCGSTLEVRYTLGAPSLVTVV
jgi:hypothetical protein